jgi:lon-related putative ATP-dependent protease
MLERATPEQLLKRCDPASLGMDGPGGAAPIERVVGQARALQAIQFGVQMRRKGYNIFALGPTGSGRHTVVKDILQARAKDEAVPSDWVYVNDFADPRRPKALRLAAGRGRALEADMRRLVEGLRAALPAAFEGDEYRARREALEKELEARQKAAAEALKAFADERSVGVAHTPGGFAVAALKDGELLPMDALAQLAPEERARIEADLEAVQTRIREMLASVPKWQKEHRDRVREMDRETTRNAVGHLLAPLLEAWAGAEAVLAYLAAVEEDVVEHAQELLRPKELDAAVLMSRGADHEPGDLRRYRVNVMVDHTETKGAPVVMEDHPTVPDLIGRIEQVSRLGTLTTDFTLVEAGALHRANGGYLVVDVLKVLSHPFAWEELKRALRSGEIRTRGLGELAGVVSTVSLEPEPIPLDVKVVLIGDRRVFYLLGRLEPELGEHFKVAADFEDDMPRAGEGERLFARLVARLAQERALAPFSPDASARVIEAASRWAGDAEKLSTNMRRLSNLLEEAAFWCEQGGRAAVAREDVQRALDEQEARLDRPRARMAEATAQGLLRVETQGSRVGQVNALSVLDLGELRFGRPSRITARVRMGRGEVVDIEREVDLGGPLHSKGVLILSGFMGGRYGRERPLAFSASLVFEQSYGGVEGDSASMAELCTLLSAIAEVPLRQDLAITGSVDQHGLGQAVGGVDEKVEGFFELCQARGLTGTQGVIIPAANLPQLMLRASVVEAVRQGNFHIWPVRTVDEALALLTGLEAGERGPDGRYPPGTVNARVEAKLADLAQAARRAAEPERRA